MGTKLHPPPGEAPAATGTDTARPLRVVGRLRPAPVPSDEPSVLLPAKPISLRRDSARRRLLAGADILALVLAELVIWLVAPPDATLPSRYVLFTAVPFWILLNKLLGLYDRDDNLIHNSTLDELPRIVHSIALGTGLAFFLSPYLFGFEMHRLQTAIFAAAALLLTPMLRAYVRHRVRRRFAAERVLIVGSGSVASVVTRKLENHPEYAVEILGCIDEAWGEEDEGPRAPLPLLGDLSEFESVCRRHRVERVVIAFSAMSHERLLELIGLSKRLAVKVTVVPRLFEAMGHLVEMDQVEGMTLMGLRGLERSRSTLALKRTLDVVGSGVGLVLLSPLLALIALAIKLDSRGPVFYAQRRIGRRNQGFPMFKFRTMVRNADALKAELAHLNEATPPMFKITDDPRITRVGRFLRRTSLDELPQLVNVLRGEMSLVGPRPLVPLEDDHVIGLHRARLDLTPGLTGPWQVMGRTAIPFQEMMKLDYLYVAEWSLWNDIKLMLRTAPVVFGARGA